MWPLRKPLRPLLLQPQLQHLLTLPSQLMPLNLQKLQLRQQQQWLRLLQLHRLPPQRLYRTKATPLG